MNVIRTFASIAFIDMHQLAGFIVDVVYRRAIYSLFDTFEIAIVNIVAATTATNANGVVLSIIAKLQGTDGGDIATIVYLKQLVEIGILEKITSGKEKLFVNPRLMKLMT